MAFDPTFVYQGLAGVVPPAIVSGVALGLAWRPWSHTRVRASGGNAWGAALAVGLGYAAGQVGIHGWPSLALSVPVKDGLFYVAVVAALCGTVRAADRLAVRVVLCAALPWYLLDFMRQHHWDGVQTWSWSAGLAAGVLGLWSGLERLARARPGPTLPLAWAAVCSCAGAALHLSGSASLAQLAGALAVPLGLAWLVSLRQPGLTLAGGGVRCVALLFAGLLLAGHFASELPGASALLLAASLLGPALGSLARGPRARRFAAVLGTMGPALAAVWLARGSLADDPYTGL